jgi:hypothetical protein
LAVYCLKVREFFLPLWNKTLLCTRTTNPVIRVEYSSPSAC